MNQVANRVYSIHYTLRDEEGQVVETTEQTGPFSFVSGTGAVISGLEAALEGRSEGETFHVSIDPEDAYGPFNPALLHEVPREEFQGIEDLRVGMLLQARTPQGMQVFSVKEISEESVTVDANHPMAGQKLHFEISVGEAREATAEDLEPAHSCCGGGHKHKHEDGSACCGGKGHGHGDHHHHDDHSCGGQHKGHGGCKH